MKRSVNAVLVSILVGSLFLAPGMAGALEKKSRDPYLGAILIDGHTGRVLFEKNADVKGYPASVLKLMVLLIALEKVNQGTLLLNDKVTVTAEASRMGGSQVYLKEGEVFTVDELLYALTVQSGNDAARALAIHIAGSKQAFVELMNQRARRLGMNSTEFHSDHGLPPGAGEKPDVTTARDLTLLCRKLLKTPGVLTYTSTKERPFRDGDFMMRNHNTLLWSYPGCDGFKTGYFRAAGFSIAATAERDGRRVIAVVLDSVSKKTRNRITSELMTKGFMMIPLPPTPTPTRIPYIATPAPEEGPAAEAVVVGEEVDAEKGRGWGVWVWSLVWICVIVFGVILLLKLMKGKYTPLRK